MSWQCPECGTENIDDISKCYCGYFDSYDRNELIHPIQSSNDPEEKKLDISNKGIKAVALIQILGGVFGLLIIFIFQDISLKTPEKFVPILSIIYALLSLLSIISGYSLWKENRFGVTLSIINQILQLPYIVTPYFLYELFFGISFKAYTTSLKTYLLNYSWGSSFYFYIGQTDFPYSFGMNLVPFVVLIFLTNIKKA